MEIKLSALPRLGDLRRLDRAAEFIGASHRLLVSHTPTPPGDDHRGSLNLRALGERLEGLGGWGKS